MKYTLEIKEKAIGKERPRFNIYQKKTYTPQKTKNYENMIKMSFIEKYGKKIRPSANEIYVKIDVYYAPPKSYSKKKRQMLIDGVFGYMHKPDCDNIAKAVLDALNGLVWNDDKQVVGLLVMKAYGEENQINIEIREVERNDEL